jgi:hypothetical protein
MMNLVRDEQKMISRLNTLSKPIATSGIHNRERYSFAKVGVRRSHAFKPAIGFPPVVSSTRKH